MAAYPFAQAPTTAQLAQALSEHCGVTVEQTRGPLIGPRGKVITRYFRRITDNGVLASEPLGTDDERVGWDKLWRICRQLGVDVTELGIPGLHLGPTA